MWWSNLFKDMSPASFFNFSFLPKYAAFFIQGIEYTLLLAVVSVLLAVLPALLLALMRLSKSRLIRGISGAYIAVFRSTPLLVQLSIIYFGLFGAVSIPRITVLGFVDISRFIPGVVALALNSSAYVAEIFRGGIEAIPVGQYEAAEVLGYNKTQTFFHIILPQMIKTILPSMTNEVITLVKDTSMAFTLAYNEMFSLAKQIAASQTSFTPFVIAGIFYFVANYLVAFGMERIEKAFDYYH